MSVSNELQQGDGVSPGIHQSISGADSECELCSSCDSKVGMSRNEVRGIESGLLRKERS